MGVTKIWPASRPVLELDATTIAIHLPTLFSGPLPPFLDFLGVVLSHFQIHAMHLEPKSILVHSTFAFLCKDFVGVAPSVALLSHFFCLQLTEPNQCSECASLLAVSTTTGECIYMGLRSETEGFRRQLVFVDVSQYNPLLLTPSSHAVSSSGWEHTRLDELGLFASEERTGHLEGIKGQLGAELEDDEARFNEEQLCLAHGWRKLDIAVKLGRCQRDAAHSKYEKATAVAEEACEHAFQEAAGVDRRHEAAEAREHELQPLCVLLEQQLDGRRSSLSCYDESLATCQANLRDLEQELTLTSTE
ncbi:hypothetical protein D1007_00878 [Hordeum vulgare]|nr:hypothetical protein D1007_00878 [Hordeum vulgare]